MKFKVKNKTGFVTNERDLLILDKSKIPFYYRNGLTGNYRFNLPVGTYYTKSKITKLQKPCYYTTPGLKPAYYFKPFPKRFHIIYMTNPNKCSVDLNRAVIIFDKSFKKSPRFIKDFIKFHELGHYRYTGKGQTSEKDCDNFAAYCMIRIGYNPSQISVANKYTLGNDHYAIDRKINNNNYLQAFKQY